MLFCRGVLPYLNGPSFKALDFRLHTLPSASFSAALPRGHAALAFVDMGAGFADNTYRGWTQIGCQGRHWDTDRREEGMWVDQRRDGGTNSTLRIKEQETRLTLNEHDDDDKTTLQRL